MMTCQEATQLLSMAQDEKLPAGKRVALRLHTTVCSGCRNAGKQFQEIRRLIRLKEK